MKLNKKKLISGFLVILSIAAVIWIAFSNNELGNAWEVLGSLDLKWVAGIFACWFFYMFFDAVSHWVYLKQQGFQLSITRSVRATLIGFYYSDITPSSAGGQPMHVSNLRKAGIPVGYGTMSATIHLICNQFAVAIMSLLFWVFNRPFVSSQLGDLVWFVRIGWIINFAAVPLVLMAAFQRKLLQKIAIWMINIGAKLRLVRNPEATTANVTKVLDTFHTAQLELLHHPGQILIQVICSALSILGVIASVWFVYKAFGLSGTPWYRIITISFLLFVSASYTPLPGASGAQEGGFMTYFAGIFPGDKLGLALLVWRFFTFYLFLIVGVGTVILDKILSKEKRKKNPPEEGKTEKENEPV